jgi:hypothetical protein
LRSSNKAGAIVDVLSPEWIHGLIHTYGLWALFTVLALESMGLPAPGETALVAAALYAQRTQQLDISAVVLVAAAAAITGDNIGYLIGRTIGIVWSRASADTSDSMKRGSRSASICSCDTAARSSSSAGSSPSCGPSLLSLPVSTACPGHISWS